MGRNRRVIYALIPLFLLLVTSGSVAETPLVLATFDYPPLMFDKPDRSGRRGIGVDALRRALVGTEFSLTVKMVPSKRAMHLFESGRVDLFLGSRLDLPGYEGKILPVQLLTLKSALFCAREQCRKLAHTEGYQQLGDIATIPGSPVNLPLKNAGNRVHVIQSLPSSFEFLRLGRADYVAAIDFAGLFVIRTMPRFRGADIQISRKVLMTIPYDVVIQKDAPYSSRLERHLRRKFAELATLNNQEIMSDYFNGDRFFSAEQNQQRSR